MPTWTSSSSASAWSTQSPWRTSPPNGSHRSVLETKPLPSFWSGLSQTSATMWKSSSIWTSGAPNQCTSAGPGGWHTGSELTATWSVRLWHSTTSKMCSTGLYLLPSSTNTLALTVKSSACLSVWRLFVIVDGGKSSGSSDVELEEGSFVLRLGDTDYSGTFRTNVAFLLCSALKRDHLTWLKTCADFHPVALCDNLYPNFSPRRLNSALFFLSFPSLVSLLYLLFIFVCVCVLRFCNKWTTVYHIFDGQLLWFFQISTLMQKAGENYSVDPTVEGTVSEEMEGKHKVPFGTNGHLLRLWSATLQDKSRLNPPCVWKPVLRLVSNNYLQNSHPHGIFFSEIMI